MIGGTGDLRFTGWRSWGSWRALRIALISAWCLWAVMAWWSAPRRAEVDKARVDIAANQVEAYEWADSWERPTVSTWGSVPTLRSWGRDGPLFVWRTYDGRTYYVVADAAPTDPFFVADSSEPQTESIDAAVWASLHDTGRPLYGDVRPDSRYLPTIIGLVCLAVLVAGPAPVIGTRWYWFWLTAGVPFGLGVLAWLTTERPWSRRVGSPSESDVDNRSSGLTGLLIAIAASVAVGLLGAFLRRTFDTWAIPELPG